VTDSDVSGWTGAVPDDPGSTEPHRAHQPRHQTTNPRHQPPTPAPTTNPGTEPPAATPATGPSTKPPAMTPSRRAVAGVGTAREHARRL